MSGINILPRKNSIHNDLDRYNVFHTWHKRCEEHVPLEFRFVSSTDTKSRNIAGCLAFLDRFFFFDIFGDFGQIDYSFNQQSSPFHGSRCTFDGK